MAAKKKVSTAKKSVRKTPGTGGKGKFYHIEVRPKSDFVSFRNQDVGGKGGLERLAGKRSSGRWATAAWLVDKKHARVSSKGELVITDAKERASLKKALRGKIMRVKADIFKAHPVRNVPEKEKPTLAMKRAQSLNIKKAQAARKKR